MKRLHSGAKSRPPQYMKFWNRHRKYCLRNLNELGDIQSQRAWYLAKDCTCANKICREWEFAFVMFVFIRLFL